jgi:cytochrome c-type biogenesis protein CcmE
VKKAYLVGFLVISLALGFALWALSSSMNPYVDLKVARKTQGTVQLRGLIIRDPARPSYFDPQTNSFRFWIQDDNKEEVEVVYHGAKPDAFDAAPGLSASGQLRKDDMGREIFVSNSLSVKCPSRYSDQKTQYKADGKSAGGTS